MEFVKKHKWLIFSFIIFFLISLFFPYSGDDWQWHLTSLSFQTIPGFAHNASLNGRYMSNLIVIMLTENIFIRGLIMSFVINTIIYLIHKETKTSFLLIWFLLLCMPVDTLKQSVIWSSGFANYVISTLLLLIMLKIIYNSYHNKEKHFIIPLVLTYISTLFIENLTVFLVLSLIITTIIYYLKYKKINKHLATLGISSLAGALTMFLHPAYFKVLNGTDTYRTYGHSFLDIFDKIQSNFSSTIYKFISFNNVVLIAFLIILIIIYFEKHKHLFTAKKRKLITISMYFNILYVAYSSICNHISWFILDEYTNMLNTILTILFLISIFISLLIIFKNTKIYKPIIIILCTIIGLVSPLFIVTPIGPRNFFMIYVLEIILSLLIYQELEIKFNYKPYLIIIITIISVFYTSVYARISKVYYERENYILEKSKTADYIKVPYLPYSNYVWVGNFANEYYSNLYKSILKINPDIEFEFVSYNEWEKEK